MPLISIIVPNFNHAAFLKKRIDSILEQTFKDFEILILDDCSHDESKTVIESYRQNPYVSTIIYNTQNSGSTFSQWEKGINLSKGKYIWIAESDDYAENNILSTLVKQITDADNIVISYCQSKIVDGNDNAKGIWPSHSALIRKDSFSNDFVIKGDDFIHQYLQYENVIPNASAVLFSKEAYLATGGVDQNIKYCADWHLWLKISLEGNIAFSHLPLNAFRRHEKSVIATAQKNRKGIFFYKYDILMRENFLEYLSTSNKGKSSLINDIHQRIKEESKKEAWYLSKKKKMIPAIQYFKKYLKY